MRILTQAPERRPARLVETIAALGDHAFKALLLDRSDDFGGGASKVSEKRNSPCFRGITWFTRRARLGAENLLLRQQLVVLRRKSPTRVRLWNIDRLLLVWLYRLYPSLLDAIIIVQPETVIHWHRRGFRACWRWKSRRVGGRPRMDSGIRALIRRMSRENPLWGAPRIHGELLMLGIEVAESTVGRYMVRRRR